VDILGTGSNILLIILGFGLLIALHELGHFIAARWAGIRADGFAIGMGPVVASFRKGVGFRFGSCDEVVKKKLGKLPIQLSDRELEEAGLGETEYSLRLLPIGGYVKMLGQEDGNPNATSEDPRSYGKTPVGRRMIVVSAGVVMNLITAVVMFVIAFMIGVRFEAPVIGMISPGSPAALAVPVTDGSDPDPAGTPVGLQPGDRIVRIDDAPALTFSDVMIESAMSVPGRPLRIEVERVGVEKPLRFDVEPEFEPAANMRLIGVAPAASTTLGTDPQLIPYLGDVVGDDEARSILGHRLAAVGGAPITSWDDFDRRIDAADGKPVSVTFDPVISSGESATNSIELSIAARPRLELIPDPDSDFGPESGLAGLVPLVRIDDVPAGSRNGDVFQRGDVVMRVADLTAPRMNEFRAAIKARPGEDLPLVLQRDGREIEVIAKVDGDGMIGVLPGYALDLPRTARPIDSVGDETTPIGPLRLLPGTRIDQVGGRPVEDWDGLRAALLAVTADSAEKGGAAEVTLSFTLPLQEARETSATIELDAKEVAALHALGWTSPLPSNWFEPLQTTLSANGDPLEAAAMGFRQTWKMVVLTYLTIDRLVSGSVSVKQLHGPVGIVHIGTKVADRGMMYLLFFLAMISVNLAVLNFLPLPIVDGGLFLFLIYEKFRGRPPSIAFQNAAALIGLALIGTLFVVTFFNDVMRLTGSG
jgi:regulator of sigma E protease